MDPLVDSFWDAVVVGTGMGGAASGYVLAKGGLRVLFLEKGLSRDESGTRADDYAEAFFPLAADRSARRDVLSHAGRWTDEIVDRSEGRRDAFVPFLGSGEGGSSALYGMVLERFRPEDFSPWPITYDDLAPHYDRAEEMFGIDGFAPLSPPNEEMREFLRARGVHPHRLPVACDFDRGLDGSQGYLDGTGAKRDAGRVFLRRALHEHGAALVDRCEVVRLEASRNSVQALECVRDGQSFRVRARMVILAAGAIATPALLLSSRSAEWPDGLANDSGLVGRNLMRHCIDLYAVECTTPVAATHNVKQLGFDDFYRLGDVKLGTVQSFGRLPPAAVVIEELRQRIPALVWRVLGAVIRRGLPFVLARMFRNRVLFAAIMEDSPSRDNRVSVAPRGPSGERPAIEISYRVTSPDRERVRLFRRQLAKVFGGRSYLLLKEAENNHRLAHACGTCRAGTDPAVSVVDENGRAHGLSNLIVADASFFPSSGGTNPGLTIAANAMRIAAACLSGSALGEARLAG